jgi:peptide/nickel transport system substrate-binding protein
MKRNLIFFTISVVVIISMLGGSIASTAQSLPPEAQSAPLTTDMTAEEVMAVMPRSQTLYLNGLQWGSLVGFNPYSNNMNNALAIAQQDNARVTVFETPYIYNMLSGEVTPLLADGPYSWNEDRTELTFSIKAATHWSDGTPVTAEDVAYTWATNIHYQTMAGVNFQDYIDDITAVDPATIRVMAKLDQYNNAVNPLLVEAYLSTNYVIQKDWTQILEARTGGDPNAFLNDPAFDLVSSGPYLNYFFNDQIVVLVRDDNYWGQDASMWGRLPAPKYLAHVIYPDNEAGVSAFKAGTVDVSQQFIPNVQDLWLVEGLPVSTYLPDAPYMIGASLPTAFYNLSSYGLDQLAIRKAIAIAVDYNRIIADAMANQSATFQQVPRSIMNTSPGEQALYDHDAMADLQWAGDDIAGANALLDAAGIVDTNADGWREYNGQTLNYVATAPYGWNDWTAAVDILAMAGPQIGIHITTNFPEWGDYQNVVTNWSALSSTPGYDIFMMWSDGAGPTQPWARVRHLISSEYAETDGNWNGNWGGYSNPEVDTVIQAIPVETDPAELITDYTELTRIYLTDIPSFSLMYRPQSFHYVNESVWTGFPYQGDGTNPPVPPLDLIDGYSIAGLYNLELVNPYSLSYRYVDTYGETQVPYLADTEHLNGPVGLFMDGENNLFVTEDWGERVLKYDSTPNNIWSLGKAAVAGTDNYLFGHPTDVGLDNSGNVWVADNNRIVQYNPDGVYLQQLPVDDPWNPGDDDTDFNDVEGIAFDSAGHLFVSDANNHRIQVYDLSSGSPVYSATMGITGEPGNDNDHFNYPNRIAMDSINRLYITDSGNNRIQQCIFSDGWTCTPFDSGLNLPQGLTIDGSNNVYIADSNNGRIRKCSSDGTCTDYITDTGGYTDLAVDSNGNLYGTNQWRDSTVTKFDSNGQWVGPYLGVTNVPYLTDGYHYYRGRVYVDANLNILISEQDGQRLVKLDPTGNFLWSFGEAGVRGGDNNHFSSPMFVGTDSDGIIYVADDWNCRVQIISPDGNYLNTLGTGCGTGEYEFNNPFGIAVGNNGNIYVTDQGNMRVMVYDQNLNFVGQIGETGVCGSDNSHLCEPEAVAVDGLGNIYIVDRPNNRLQKFNSNLEWQMTIGNGTVGNQFDQFNWVNGVAVDDQGKIYISDGGNSRIQVFDPTGSYLTTLGGSGGTTTSQFNGTFGVAVDSEGNVYACDWGNYRIQKFAPGVPDWKQVNINGFGSPDVQAISVAPFDGQLYASTGNWTDGTQIWRTADGTTWNPTTEPGYFGSGVNFIMSMIAFDGQLYAGTGWGEPLQILRSSDGVDWTQVMTSTEYNPDGIFAFSVYGDQIYAAIADTTGNGLSILRSSTGNVGSWSAVVIGGNGDVSNVAVLDFAIFNGSLYAVGKNIETGAFVWEASDDGNAWIQVNTPGFDGTIQSQAESMAVFNGALYVGTSCIPDDSLCLTDHSQLWKTTNGTDWSLVPTDFSNSDYSDVTSLIEFDGALFAVVAGGPGGNTVWRSMDGSTWLQVNIDGWGDSNNGWSLWDRAITTYNDQLYVATTNWGASGAKIWRYEPEVVANFTATPTVGAVPLEVAFTNTSSGYLTSVIWDFGDGTASILNNPVHVYSSPGVYTVSLTVDSFGNQDMLSMPDFITVNFRTLFLPVMTR